MLGRMGPSLWDFLGKLNLGDGILLAFLFYYSYF